MEVKFLCSDHNDAPLNVMVPEEPMEMVKDFRGEEFTGVRKWPAYPARIDKTIQAETSDHLQKILEVWRIMFSTHCPNGQKCILASTWRVTEGITKMLGCSGCDWGCLQTCCGNETLFWHVGYP